MPFIVGLLQNKLAHLATRFTTKCIAFCQPTPKQSSITEPPTTSTSTTLISLNKPHSSYIAPYQRSIDLLEQLLSLPVISRFLYPLLLEEHNDPTTLHYKDPQIPLKTLFSHGYTLNIVFNELESLLVPAIDVHEGEGEIGYKCHQTRLFWAASQSQGLIANPDMIPDQLSPDTYLELDTNQPYFELMASTISRILDIHATAGRLSLQNLQSFTIQPQMVYPIPSTTSSTQDYIPSLETLTSELSSTEVTYLADLQQLSDYACTVRGILGYDNKTTSRSLFRSSVSLTGGPKQEMLDINQIFHHIDDLLSLHAEFSLRIQYLAAMPDNIQYFAAAYQGLQGRWDVYARYAAQYDKSRKVYQAALPVLKQLSGCSSLDPEVDVPALLLRPIQRLAQYPLIFQSILDAARFQQQQQQQQQPSVIESMKEALNCSKQVLKRTNEAARESLNELEEKKFLDTVDPESLSSHRLSASPLGRLQLFGPQMYVRMNQSNSSEPTEVYLFENYLILARQQTTKIHKSFSIQSLTNRRQSKGSSSSKRSSQMSLSTKCGSPRLPPLDIPTLDTVNITPIKEKTLNSYASLNSLRETVNMELDNYIQQPPQDSSSSSQLLIRGCFPVSCIYQVGQQEDELAPGYHQLILRIQDSGGIERIAELRQLPSETASIWIRKLKRTILGYSI